jgi:hypothetical protein
MRCSACGALGALCDDLKVRSRLRLAVGLPPPISIRIISIPDAAAPMPELVLAWIS